MAVVRHLGFAGRLLGRPVGGLHRRAKFGRNRWRNFDNMKLSIFCPLGLKTLIHAPKLGFSGISPPKWGAMSTKPLKGTLAGRNGYSDVLIMSLSVTVPEKSRGNKKCDKEEEERHISGLFGIAVKWS